MSGEIESGNFEQNLLLDDLESFFKSSQAPYTEYEQETPHKISNFNENTDSQDLNIDMILEQDITDFDIDLLQDTPGIDTNGFDFIIDENESNSSDSRISEHGTHNAHNDLHNHTNIIDEQESFSSTLVERNPEHTEDEKHLNDHYLVDLGHVHIHMHGQAKVTFFEEVPMNHNQNDKMCHVEEHHLYQDEEILQNDEDFLLPSVEAAEHIQDEEQNPQDEIVSLSPDCGYQSPQLSEDEAHTIHRCVEILKDRKDIFAGEDLLLQAQALLSEPQSLLSRSSSPSSVISESTSSERVCRKRK